MNTKEATKRTKEHMGSLLAWTSLLTHMLLVHCDSSGWGASKQRIKVSQEKEKDGSSCFLSFSPTYLKKYRSVILENRGTKCPFKTFLKPIRSERNLRI